MATYVEALQATLAGEHAAVAVYGYLGAQTSESAQARLYDTIERAYAAHRERRDVLAARLVEAGEEPVAAAPAYELPELGGDPDALAPAALALEDACAATYGVLVASSPTAVRRFAVDLLLDAAVRALTFGGEPERYPGR